MNDPNYDPEDPEIQRSLKESIDRAFPDPKIKQKKLTEKEKMLEDIRYLKSAIIRLQVNQREIVTCYGDHVDKDKKNINQIKSKQREIITYINNNKKRNNEIFKKLVDESNYNYDESKRCFDNNFDNIKVIINKINDLNRAILNLYILNMRLISQIR